MRRVITPLVLLLCVLILALFFRGSDQPKNIKSLTATPTKAQQGSDEAKIAIVKFFTTYDTCMKQPPAEAQGEVSGYCQAHNELSSESFVTNMSVSPVATLAADVVLCSQNPPSGYEVSDVRLKGNTADAVVVESFATAMQQLKVLLKRVNSEWKVDNVICPIPS